MFLLWWFGKDFLKLYILEIRSDLRSFLRFALVALTTITLTYCFCLLLLDTVKVGLREPSSPTVAYIERTQSNGLSILGETRSLCRLGYISQFKTRAICSTNIAGSKGLVSTAATPN